MRASSIQASPDSPTLAFADNLEPVHKSVGRLLEFLSHTLRLDIFEASQA